MSSKKPSVIAIAIVTGEDIEPTGLPVLTVKRIGERYFLQSGKHHLEKAVEEAIEHLDKSDRTLVFLAVDVQPMERRQRRGVKKS